MAKLTGKTAPRRPNLVSISATVVSRSELALAAVKLWKNDPAIRAEFHDAGEFYDHMDQFCRHLPAEEKEALTMAGTNAEGSEYGLSMHKAWVASGRPGKFSDFLRVAREQEREERLERAKTGRE